jgi:hypothetical protein
LLHALPHSAVQVRTWLGLARPGTDAAGRQGSEVA